VLRDASGQRTIGGATVIDPHAPRRAGERAARLVLLEALRECDPGTALAQALACAAQGIDPRLFAYARNLAPDAVRVMARALGAVAVLTRDGERLVRPREWQALCDALVSALAAHHCQQPESVGPREGELVRALAPGARSALAHAALGELLRAGAIVRDGVSLRLPAHRAQLGAADEALWQRVAQHLHADALKPPSSGDLARTLELELPALLAFLESCARRGLLVRIAPNRFFHPQALARLALHAEQLSREHTESGFDARRFRDATGIGRNLTIEVLEYFDAAGLTRRHGEVRRAIRSSQSVFGVEPAG
jgi:selenocysteine-specific elongation factor